MQVNPEVVTTGSNSALPRNKLLIAFSADFSRKDELLAKVFGQEISHSSRIVRKYCWRTKYYSVQLDIYIDELENLSNWCDELMSPEFQDLRDVLAGIIVVGSKFDPDSHRALHQLSKCLDESMEYFGILLTSEARRSDEDEMVGSFELIHCDENESNEYNESLGIGRVKEVIDTHNWDADIMQMKQAKQAKQASAVEEIDCKLPSQGFSLEELMHKLEEARTNYQQMSSGPEASQFAEDISEQLSRCI
ncbi:LAMI_0D02146g1_1 [Lachancea mirantina]|uniref:Increased recombination centers protein 6 n=1 Tax=Lachancea mirantina TaxID=1230905 RepID=A0A1G4J902_9SACH|nr:LAMI_0D02146g1_1 [Lachancea mirantina]